MSARVLFRYLLARDQLAPALDHVEGLIREEKWRDARDALQAYASKLGISVGGGVEPSGRLQTEWFQGLDQRDKDTVVSLFQTLMALAQVVWPMAIGHPVKFEMMRLEALLRTLRGETRAVEELRRDDSDALKIGRFMVIPLKGVTDTSGAVDTLNEASKHIEGKFPKVLYGKVYIRADLRPSGTYDARPGALIAGAYQAATDTITLSMYSRPERNSVMTVIHEFGHRYHTRFLPGDKREKFIELSTVGDVHTESFKLAERERFAEEYMVRDRGFRDDESFGNGGPVHLSPRADFFFKNFPRDEFKAKVSPLHRRFIDKDESVVPDLLKALARSQFGGNLRIVDDEDNLQPVYASEYGRTDWQENFAESFLAYCMGKALPKPLQAFMESL